MRSPPIELEWMGWRSTTPVLQRCGWAFAEEQNHHRDEVSLVFHNKQMGITGKSRPFSRYDMHQMSHGNFHNTFTVPVWGMDIREQRIAHMSPVSNYELVDMEPSYTEEIFDPSAIFKRADSGLLIPEDTVPDLLTRIQELQEPARQERLREQVRERARDKSTQITSAQIIQLRAA